MDLRRKGELALTYFMWYLAGNKTVEATPTVMAEMFRRTGMPTPTQGTAFDAVVYNTIKSILTGELTLKDATYTQLGYCYWILVNGGADRNSGMFSPGTCVQEIEAISAATGIHFSTLFYLAAEIMRDAPNFKTAMAA